MHTVCSTHVFSEDTVHTDAKNTVAKVKRVRRSYARKIQILTVGEQRAKVMGKKTVASVFKQGKASIRNARNKRSKRTRSKKRS